MRALQRVVIQVDLDEGRLPVPQYHPCPVWLHEHGYSTSLARCVHVPRAEHWIAPKEFRRQPWVLLHELAHAYHHQVLGYDWQPIVDGWKRVKASGKYERVLHVFGGKTRHYALQDAKEYFAEMTETYLGVNDFYPFVRAELDESDPETAELLRTIWETLTPNLEVDAARSGSWIFRKGGPKEKSWHMPSKDWMKSALGGPTFGRFGVTFHSVAVRDPRSCLCGTFEMISSVGQNG